MNKRKIFWAVLFLVLAGCSIWAVIAQCKEFTREQFVQTWSDMNPIYLLIALLCMFGFILFEGLAILRILHAFGYRRSLEQGLLFASADIYVSAITPSATGGQPASAYFMLREKIPAAVVTVTLLINLVMYTAAIVSLGIFCILVQPVSFLQFHLPGRILIVVGYVIIVSLGSVFLLLLTKEQLVYRIAKKILHLFHRLHLIRKDERWEKKLNRIMEDYKQCAAMIAGKKRMLFEAFSLNLLQRVSQVMVTVFVFLAMGGEAGKVLETFVIQSMVAIGSNCVPVPGAMGVADYLLLDGFRGMMVLHEVITLELVSRSISFYSCIFICGVMVITRLLADYRRGKTNDRIF